MTDSPLTVDELIEALQKYDGNKHVRVDIAGEIAVCRPRYDTREDKVIL